jgi:hypothetical protein
MEQMSAASRIFLLTFDKAAYTLLSNVEERNACRHLLIYCKERWMF